jgi:glyoxylase-like metal-dependent hydrolase (beta-lactamase superfamily II)
MRIESMSRSTAVGALAVAVGAAGLVPAAVGSAAPTAAANARAGQVSAALQRAVDAVGGAAALRDLRSFRYSASTQRWVLDEAFRAGAGAELAATVESRVRYVLPAGGRRAELRVDAVRTSSGGERPVHEVIAGRRGFIRGVDANFSTAAVKSMTSDRWAAIRKEQTLLNPHLVLDAALRRPARVKGAGTRTIDGRRYRVVVVQDNVAPIRLFINARTGRLAMLRTTEHDYLRRDVPIVVRYARWVGAGDGVRFPSRVSLTSDGEPMIREVRNRGSITANPRVRNRVFAFPENLDVTAFDAGLARIGERTSQWLMSFVNLGFIKDGGQTAINPLAVTDGANTAEGITLLGGVANNSMIVERNNGIVVVEGALHNFRAEAVIRYIRRNFPGQRITHVITSHHHADHASGMRPYVALGATVVVGQEAAQFFRRVFAERSSTILPDRLDGSNVRATVRGVPDAGLSLTGAQSEIDVFQIRNTHAADMVVPYVQDQGVLFTSDIYSPPTLPSPDDPAARAIVNLVNAQGLSPEWIVGGHGTFIAYADFEAAMGQ